MEFDLGANVTDLWLRFRYNPKSAFRNNNESSLVIFFNSSGTAVARLRCPTNNQYDIRLEYWNGSAWVTTAGLDAVGSGVNEYVIHLECGVSGTFEWWYGTVLQESIFGLNSAVDNVRRVRIGCPSQSGSQSFSEFACADFDLRGMLVRSAVPNANGTYTDGTGSFSDVDDIPLNSSTGKVFSAVGNKATFTKASISFPPGYQIEAVAVNGNSRVSGGSVTQGRNILRIGSTDYNSVDIPLTAAFLPSRSIWENSPATSVKFTPTEFNGMEFGVEARA